MVHNAGRVRRIFWVPLGQRNYINKCSTNRTQSGLTSVDENIYHKVQIRRSDILTFFIEYLDTFEMASGFGYYGNRSRCFTFWQEFRKCYAMADRPEQCTLQMDDYFECLHHTKEKARAKAIKDQELKLNEEKKKQDELSRKLTDSANKSNVTRLGIIDNSVKQKEASN
ncbi:unnamed protein product [Rhizophagus irregularis]|nr:unnamed protein product [Rhizophagus irregularis]